MMNKEFARRRRTLMRMLGDDAIAIVPAASMKVRNRDVEYEYRQDSDFLYLTGFEEPDAMLVLLPGRRHAQFILFCRERDPVMETWTGRRLGPEGAIEILGADDAFPIDDIDEILPGLLEDRERVYYTMGRDLELDQRVMSWVNQIKDKSRGGAQPPHEFIALDYLLHDLRLFKSRHELSEMRRAVKASVAGHLRAMEVCQPGMYEYQIEAELLYEFTYAGCEYAYPSIVGGGHNGCILHYTENKDVLCEGDLLLIDAGAECHGYAADITRTFPVSGEYSPVQRELYELVLEAQLAAIQRAVPGNHWNDPHNAAVQVLTRGLVGLGLLKGRVPGLIKEEKYKKFYMHRTGHWLGLDVHDVGDYKIDDEWRLFEPGMTLTVEPGLYIAPDIRSVPKRFRGIGIRIEDDVLITRDGNDVLTKALIKHPDDIESFMAQAWQ